jgi:hypothetical protein
VTIPSLDSYRLLVISRYQVRGEGVPLIDDVQKILLLYFDRPDRVVGKMQYHLEVIPPGGDPQRRELNVEFPR